MTLQHRPARKAGAGGGQEAHLSRSPRSPRGRSQWHFLTGERPQIDALADAIGWHYQCDSQARSVCPCLPASCWLRRQGRISQYYYGVRVFRPRACSWESSKPPADRIGSLADQVLLFVITMTRAPANTARRSTTSCDWRGAATVLVLGSSLFIMFRRDPMRKKSKTGRA